LEHRHDHVSFWDNIASSEGLWWEGGRRRTS